MLVTVREASQTLGISKKRIYKSLKIGKISLMNPVCGKGGPVNPMLVDLNQLRTFYGLNSKDLEPDSLLTILFKTFKRLWYGYDNFSK